MVQTDSNGSKYALFSKLLRDALNSLYDPRFLRMSPLIGLFELSDRIDPISVVRRTLTGAIESLKPPGEIPSDSRTWRVYQILRRRYIEQITQREVAADLGLSVRQLQREEKLAREVLADYLWRTHSLEDKIGLLRTDDTDAVAEDSVGQALTRSRELEWLKESVQPQVTDLDATLQDVLDTVEPLLASSRVSLTYAKTEQLCRTVLQQSLLRQALLDILTAAIRCVPGGRIFVENQISARQACIIVRGEPFGPTNPLSSMHLEDLETASELVRLCGGELRVTRDLSGSREELKTERLAQGLDQRRMIAVAVLLPIIQQSGVLFVDDNGDALRLFQRYLSGTPYDFIGEQDPQRCVEVAAELRPRIVVLDVMMPEHDGWRVLGDLKDCSETRGIPVVICSILSQRDLALARGAADFIRKPVSRQGLLAVLDKQFHLLRTELA